MAQGQTDPTRRPWWLPGIFVVALLMLVGVGLFFVYRRYEPDRLTRQARSFLEKGDYRSAVLTVRRALGINPANQGASRLMAEITEHLQVPDALDWRRRVAELNPGSSGEALAWAGTALRMGKTAAAEQALASVPESERHTASYQSKAGTLAVSAGKWKDAEKFYAEALRLEPSNELHQYNYATLQLQSPDAAQRKAGSETLERLARNGRVQAFAQRALITRAVREEKWDAALAASAALQKDPAAQFADRLTYLDLLRRAQKPKFASALEAAKTAAATDAANASLLLNWMRLNGLSDAGAKWAATLGANIQSNPRVAAAYAECLVEVKDWPALRKLLGETPWTEYEELRLAFLARNLREEGDVEGSHARWSQAAGVAAKTRETAARLAYLATRWGWKDEAREMLWAAAEAAAPQWALHILHRLCENDGDTTGMLRVATKLAEIDPQDEAARNNVAMLSLLLGRDLEGAFTTSKALYEKSPTNPVFASTYALALHLRGNSAEAVAVLRKLSPEQLREPTMAAYYGFLLARTGATTEAQPFLELGNGAHLLPEEKVLLTNSRH